jgi:hypothetical protein
MMGNKKQKSLPPSRLRGNRDSRLSSANVWLTKFGGVNIIRGYKNRYGLSWECAITELRMLGVKLNEKYVENVLKSERAHIDQRQLRKIKKEQPHPNSYHDSDELFSFIAGYTEGGAPFGESWKEDE